MDQNPKQLIVEKLKSANNILVTVSKDPTVDQLAAALGLTLMLNALSGHAVTVFSGQIPNALEFLNPERAFDSTVDSLRDFIISIDKEKADKLRYKVEDNVVRIFITPYKTTLSENDLSFSQGDYNVDVVVALGVTNRNDLDQAITTHGRILHDATIASITAGGESNGDLGAVNWHDPAASCLSEMLVSMSEALQSGMLDKAMSTAFLTGIVSATDRFSNDKTTPKVMTMSAQLMAAGADQQLISKNLRMDRGRTKDLQESQAAVEASQFPKSQDDSVLDLHSRDDIDDELKAAEKTEENPLQELQEEIAEETPAAPDDGHKIIKNVKSQSADSTELEDREPSMGGVFNATSQAAHEDVKSARSSSFNKDILTHDKAEPTSDLEFGDVKETGHGSDEEAETQEDKTTGEEEAEQNDEIAAKIDHELETPQDLEQARNAVAAAIEFTPDHNPTASVGAQPLEMVGADPEVDTRIEIDPQGNIKPLSDTPPEPATPVSAEPPRPTHFVNQPSPMGEEPTLPPPATPQPAAQPAAPEIANQPAPPPPMAPPPLPPKPESSSPPSISDQAPSQPPASDIDKPTHGYLTEPPEGTDGDGNKPDNPLFTQQL